MRTDDMRGSAERLIDQMEDVLLDYGMFAWPWQPFQSPSHAELQDRRCRKLLAQLALIDDRDGRLGVAEELVSLDRHVLKDGILEAATSYFYVYDNFEQITKFETLTDFEEAFRTLLPWWKEDEPDWAHLGNELLTSGLVSLLELRDLTLIDIRRFLSTLPPDPINAGPLTVNEPMSYRYQWAFENPYWIVRFNGSERHLPDQKGCHYISYLLSRPNQLISSEELYGLRGKIHVEQDAGESRMDRRYREDAGGKLKDLLGQLEKAQKNNDLAGQTQIQSDIDPLVQRLERDFNPKGDGRLLRSRQTTKMYQNVKKRIDDIRRLVSEAGGVSGLGNHLFQIQWQESGWIYEAYENLDWKLSID